VTSVTKGATQKLSPKNVRLSKHADMTIHWKAIEVHFLMVPIVFSIKPFSVNSGKRFSVFFSNNLHR
jgi:hypothetical protein